MTTSPIRHVPDRITRLAFALFALFAGFIASPADLAQGRFMAAAIADDDDGGDDDGGDDDGDDGGSRRGGRESARSFGRDGGRDDDDDRRPRASQRTRQSPPRRAPARPLPEFVVSAPSAADMDRILALGFRQIAREQLALTGTHIARLRATRRISLQQARRLVAGAVPLAVLDLNTRYRTNDFACRPDDCRAFAAVGWQTSAGACTLAPRIGIIDTGVELKSPALNGSRVELLSTRSPGRKRAATAHGTAVAALVAGAVGGPAPGLLPAAEIIVVDAFHRAGRDDVADAFDVVRALDRLGERRVDVINLSFAGAGNLVLGQAISALAATGTLLVAAAGNGGPRAAPLYPAAYPEVIAVTAVDSGGRAYRQAGAGSHVAFAAPGVRLWTAYGRSGRYRSGTSYAAPFVTAALAVLRARDPEMANAMHVDRLARAARDAGTPGRDPTFGWGILTMPECTAEASAMP